MRMAKKMMSTASRHVNWSETIRSYQFIRPALLGARDDASSRRLDCRQHLQEIDRLAHVVDAYERRAGALRRRHRGQRADGARRTGGVAGDVADERLP